MNPVEEMYLGALQQDAFYSGRVKPIELLTARNGWQAWLDTFPAPPATDGENFSRFAGRDGHRWAWLINEVGWDTFVTCMANSQWVESMRRKAVQEARGK